MRYCVRLQWRVIVELPQDGLDPRNRLSMLINPKGGNGFLSSIGGSIRASYAPVVLDPTVIFHQALDETRKAQNLSGKKFPYKVEDFIRDVTTRANIKLHLFGSVLSLGLALDEFEVGEAVELENLQKLESHPRLVALVCKIIGMLKVGEPAAEAIKTLPKYYPSIRLVSLKRDAEDWPSRMVALLIRHISPLSSVVETVLEKNAHQQVDRSLVLVDRQGIVAYVPFDAHDTAAGNLQRFGNVTSMLELAAVLKVQISKGRALPVDIKRVIMSPDDAISNSVSAQRAWVLMNREFLLSSELNYSDMKASIAPMPRLLLVTVTNVESRSVLNAFAKAVGHASKLEKIHGYLYQNLGHLAGFEVFLAISEMGAGGLDGSQVAVRKAIEAIKPVAVMMVGIAFGVDKDKFSIGDVLVSKQLLLYDLQRISSDSSIMLRGNKIPSSAAPVNWVRHAALTWPQSKPKVEVGLLLSGDKLIDNKDFLGELTALAPEALGGEMEGAGLYVACQEAGVDWVMIKAICDWADGNKKEGKAANQELAANNAADFLVHVLQTMTP